MSAKQHQLESFGPVPETWGAAFYRRQTHLRKKLAEMLRSAPPAGYLPAALSTGCWYYEPEEIDFALKYMVSDGAARLIDGRYLAPLAVGEKRS